MVRREEQVADWQTTAERMRTDAHREHLLRVGVTSTVDVAMPNPTDLDGTPRRALSAMSPGRGVSTLRGPDGVAMRVP
jgi:hypothetical protein